MCSRCSDSGLLAFPVESMFRLDTAERQRHMTARPIPGTRNIVRRLGTNDASGVIVGAPPTPLIARVPCDESRPLSPTPLPGGLPVDHLRIAHRGRCSICR